ncbi:hypothetical protein L1D26_22465 [Vibrio mediterranei]|uniref:hypothetical protein n=1 Tax=Vibrio mediterranei TaxID=689 RepID=UPI001EFE48F6|nr:hypothetical protein [Vibrio mediterranei]MCG9665817.1 hypothetical protein [Vibrio mediterranei]
MSVIAKALELQNQFRFEEYLEEKFFESCLRAGIITLEELGEKKDNYTKLRKFLTVNKVSINLYRISQSRVEKPLTEEELEEVVNDILKILSKKLIDELSVEGIRMRC